MFSLYLRTDIYDHNIQVFFLNMFVGWRAFLWAILYVSRSRTFFW